MWKKETTDLVSRPLPAGELTWRFIDLGHYSSLPRSALNFYVSLIFQTPGRSVNRSKTFDFEPFMGIEIKGKVLGVVGTGKIGNDVIRIAQGFGMKVVAFAFTGTKGLPKNSSLLIFLLKSYWGE